MALDPAVTATRRVRPAAKTVVRRLIYDVINGGRLELLDNLYAPALSARAPL